MGDSAFRREHRQALIDDRVSGASQLARQGLDSLAEYAGSCPAADAAELRRELLAFAEELQFSRPSMAPVYNLAQRFADQVDRLDVTDLAAMRTRSAAIAEELSDQSLEAVAGAARHAAALIDAGATVITHSSSSTVRGIFEYLPRDHARVIVSESRPGMEGRDQAHALATLGVPITYITEAQIGLFAGEATLAIVGADAILADGAVVNRAGTLLLALAARHHGIPFYACCESFKHSPFGPEGFELDEMPAKEVEPPRHKCVTARNIFFDITPARLVDGWITERGTRRNGS